MSYPVEAPVAAQPRRPATVTAAAGLLALMAVVGLGYAVATLAVVPGVVSRFRADAGGADDVAGVVLLVWTGAGVAVVLAVLLFALYVVLALALRRGSNAARVVTLVVCGLGLVAGCASAAIVFAQRGGSDGGAGLAAPLNDAYPPAWVGLNVALAIAQMVGYLTVGALLLASPGQFFRRGTPATPVPTVGPYGAYGALPGMPGLYNAPAGPATPAVPYGSPYGSPPGPHPGYGGGPQANPYGSPAGPGGTGAPAAPRPPEPGPDDQFWARPSS